MKGAEYFHKVDNPRLFLRVGFFILQFEKIFPIFGKILSMFVSDTNLREWLVAHKSVVKVFTIGKQAGISLGHMTRFMEGGAELTAEQNKALGKIILTIINKKNLKEWK